MSKKLKFSPKGFLDFFGKAIFDIAQQQNHSLQLTGYRYKSDKVPEEFEGFRIIHLSDMHNCVYGNEADDLMIRQLQLQNTCRVPQRNLQL